MQTTWAQPGWTRRAGVAFAVTLVLMGVAPLAIAEARGRDRDRDGLGNRYERRVSETNPRRADTDRDGLRDRFELRRSHTNPRRRDTDRDGVSDRREVRLRRRRRDRDHDGLRGRYERRVSKTNPRRADTDRDRLRDGFEVRRSRTNPRRRDTDRDGLSDWREVRRLKTNPRRRDTDGDGLTDGQEVRRFKTNPRRADTDRDGVPDGQEVLAGSDPRNANSKPAAAAPSGPQVRCDSTVNSAPALLAAARSGANEGKVVCARGGDYGELRFEDISHPVKVTIRAAPGEQAILRYTVVRNVQGLRIEAFRMPAGGFDLQPSDNQRIEIVGNNIGGGQFGGVLVWYGARDILIEDNHFHDLLRPANATDFADGYGISSRGGDSRVENLRIRYNTFERTQNDALEIGSTYGGQIVGNVVRNIWEVNAGHVDPLMFWSNSSDFLIKDNRFLDNWNASIFISGDSRNLTVENNLVARSQNWCATAGYAGSSSAGIHNSVFRRNTFYDCGRAFNGGGAGGGYGLNVGGSAGNPANRIERNILASFGTTGGTVLSDNWIGPGGVGFVDRVNYVPTGMPTRGYRPARAGHTP